MIEWLWSIAFYTSVIFGLVGAAGIIHPLRRVHRGRRTHAAVMLVIGAALAYAISLGLPRAHSVGAAHGTAAAAPAA